MDVTKTNMRSLFRPQFKVKLIMHDIGILLLYLSIKLLIHYSYIVLYDIVFKRFINVTLNYKLAWEPQYSSPPILRGFGMKRLIA